MDAQGTSTAAQICSAVMEFDQQAGMRAHEKNTSASNITSKSSSSNHVLRPMSSVRAPSGVTVTRSSVIVEHYSEIVQVFDCHKAAIDKLKSNKTTFRECSRLRERVDAALRSDNVHQL